MRRASRLIIVLVTFLLGFGLHRAVAHGGAAWPPRSLGTLPLAVGPWQGVRDALTPDILAILHPDDYILRWYRTAGGVPGSLPIGVYVAYYGHQRLNERIHSPSACLPAGGWIPVEVGRQQIAIHGDPPRHIDANRYLVQKGTERGVVLYWFQGRGRTVASDVQATLLLAYDTLRGRGSDETLVRITAPVRSDPRGTLAEEIRFVQLFYPQLRHLLTGG